MNRKDAGGDAGSDREAAPRSALVAVLADELRRQAQAHAAKFRRRADALEAATEEELSEGMVLVFRRRHPRWKRLLGLIDAGGRRVNALRIRFPKVPNGFVWCSIATTPAKHHEQRLSLLELESVFGALPTTLASRSTCEPPPPFDCRAHPTDKP